METTYMYYRKLTSNKICGVLLLPRRRKLQENVCPTLNRNFLESIRDLKLQGKQIN